MELAPGSKHFEERAFCVAADLGKENDPTAIAVIEGIFHSHVRIDGVIVKKWTETQVRHLERLPLGTGYVQQVQYIKELHMRPPLNGSCGLIIDDTGVGKAVGDIAVDHGLNPIRVSITAGDGWTEHGRLKWSVSKSLLISTLDAHLHRQSFKIAAALAEAPIFREELKDFRRSVSTAGRFTYDARSGRHDDLILACALGLFFFVGRKPPPVARIGRATFTGSK